jgi:hypothetical protein
MRTGDFALVKAWKGDTDGNLVFRGTTRNFNEDAAKAGKITIAEVEELVEPGEIHPGLSFFLAVFFEIMSVPDHGLVLFQMKFMCPAFLCNVSLSRKILKSASRN